MLLNKMSQVVYGMFMAYTDIDLSSLPWYAGGGC